MSFLQLYGSVDVLSQCEYYFRQYRFGGSKISRPDHARNMCEFYLGNIYVIRSRLKKFLNNLAKTCPEIDVDIGATLKSFDVVFKQELRMRNGVTHHEPFSDMAIQRMTLTGLLAKEQLFKQAGVGVLHTQTYREFMNSWARRANLRSQTVKQLLDTIAEVMVQKASFLADIEDARVPE